MMMKSPALLLTLLLAGTAGAAPVADAKAPAPAESEGARIDVIGSQEAPTVFNVVPWKDKPSRVPKKEVTTSILRETLQPLDPEVLRREIELQLRLGEAP
ncbi:MAG: hypothetical protein V4729_06580 [Pseudomonadota bacterium]